MGIIFPTSPASGQLYTLNGVTYQWDGTSWCSIGQQPFGFAFTKTPVVSKILASFDSPIAWTLPVDLPNCQATVIDSDTATAAAPTAQTDFDIQSPPGTSVGTMRFAASSLTATFINAAEDSIPLGRITQLVAPANLNGMAGNITGSIRGTRNS